MSAFSMFAQQHADFLDNRKAPTARPPRPGARAPTETDVAVLEYITAHPGSVAKDIALAAGIDPNAAYVIIRRLNRNGQIEAAGRVGQGYSWKAHA